MELRAIECWLRAMHCKIVLTQVSRSGHQVLLIESNAGWNVAMFQTDAVDLVTGRATIGEIVSRNERAALTDLWPRLVTFRRGNKGSATEEDAGA